LVRWPKPKVNMLGVSPAGLRRVLLQAIGGAAMLVWDVHSAWAACSPAAANSVVAICDGATTTTFGSQTLTNGTITVNAGASLSVTSAKAIDFASLTNVYNYGTIAAAPSANTSSFTISANSTSVTLNNYSAAAVTATTSGTGGAISVYGRTSIDVSNASTATITATASGTGGATALLADNTFIKINNSGSITASGGAASYGGYAETYGDITNASGGVISVSSTAGDSVGFYAKTYITAVNDGSITASGGTGLGAALFARQYINLANTGTVSDTTSGSLSAYGLYTWTTATVTANTGSITASATGTGAATGVRGDTSAVITNSSNGVISATTSGAGAATGVSGGQTATVSANAGQIKGTSATGTGYGIYAGSSTLTVTTNAGAIQGLSTGAGGSGSAYGLLANAGAATLGANTGTISGSAAGSGNAFGVYATTTATVTSNAGTISAASAGAGAAFAVYGRNVADVTNASAGNVTAMATGAGAAYGVYSDNTTAGAYVKVVNSGTISGSGATGAAYGVYSNLYDDVTNNSGATISAVSASGETAGVYAKTSFTGSNAGAITAATATGSNTSAGVEARTALGLSNTGVVTGATGGSGAAYGMWSWTTATLSSNTSSITGSASGSGAAYGLRGDTAATVTSNAGSIRGLSTGSGAAYGVFGAGTATVASNSGAIVATSASGAATGVTADTTAVSVTNASTGAITATAQGATGNATGVVGKTTAAVTNAGAITASAAGAGIGYGVLALTSSANVTNAGSIAGSSGTGIAYSVYAITDATVSNASSGAMSATTGASSGTAYGIRAGAIASVTNNGGSITAENTGNWSAIGILSGTSAAVSNSGLIKGTTAGAGGAVGVKSTTSATIANSNAITGTANGAGNAFGVYATTDATVTANSGTISAASSGTSGAGVGYGLYAGNTADVTNSGTISGATAGSGEAAGVYALNGDTTLTNSGLGLVKAEATGSGYAYGVYASGVATVVNAATSSITATASAGCDANGVFAYTADVTNYGALSATGLNAYGIQAWGDVTLSNDGHLTSSASTGSSYGVYSGSGTATVTNSSFIEASSQGAAYGVYAGAADVTNSGSITAASSAGGTSYGVWGNNATLTNTGTVSAINTAGGGAYGVYSLNNASVSNSAGNTIRASTQGADAYGVYALNSITVSSNSGTISAQTDGAGHALGLGVPYSFGNVTLASNSGTLSATASGTGNAYGIQADNAATVSANSGTISATSGSGTAYGIYGAAIATVSNTGVLSASSNSGTAYAVYGGSDSNASIYQLSPTSYRADATLDNALSVNASAGGAGSAYGLYGGTYAVLTNRAGASLSAVATGSGNAFGMQAGSYATVINAANALISASSASGNAYAVRSNDATTTISNSGSISATSASGLSYGLYLSGGAASLTNTNTGAISGQTASVYAGAQVANVLNWQGGNAADAKSSALTWSGTLPGQYTLGVVSPTRYGQIWFSNPSGTMAVNLDNSSTLALGSYAKAVTGVSASAMSGATGTQGLLRWQLSLSDSSNLYWDLLVTPNGMATGETKLVSALNQSFVPYFFGGTLQLDANTSTVSDNFVLDASSTNTVALGGNTATFSGVFSNATGSAGRINLGGGTAILTGTNTYTGGTGIASNTLLQIGNGGTTGTIGSGAISNSGTLAIYRADAFTLANDVSGTGGLSQVGTGTTTLTGTNTYSGTTTISAGTLQVGDGGASGTLGTGQLSNNAALVFNRSGTLTVAADISGSGSLSQTGSGTSALTGTNSYSGSTTISAGTLQIGDGGTSGSIGSGAISNSGALAINRSDAYTLANDVSGTGGLSQIGTGTSTLTGTNTYSGTTTISAGTLQIGNGGTTGSIGSGAISNSATLAINRSDLFTLANNVSGTGGLSQIGSGTTMLTGINNYTGITTISAGTLQVGNGGTIGSLGSGAVVNNDTLRFNRSDAVTVSNTISGSGTLVQQGSGALTLNGVNSYAAIDNQSTIASLTNYKGGSASSALSYSGALPTNYLTFVTSPTQYGQLNVMAYSGSMSFGLAPGSSITDGSYSGVVSGVTASAYRGASNGIFGAYAWKLVAQNGNASSWDLVVGSTSIAPGAVQTASRLVPQVDLTLNGGGLRLDNPTSIENNVKLVAGGSNTIDLAGYATTLSGNLTDANGAGAVRFAGGGSVSLTGINSYSGPTTIDASTALAIGAGGTSGNLGSGPVNNSGILLANRSDAMTLGNAISGTGSLQQTGTGTTVLAGTNTYTGGTMISAGTLQVGNGGTSGSLGTGDVLNNGVLVFQRSDELKIQNAIFGSGNLTQTGSGKIILASNNSYTGLTLIDAGTLQIGDGGTSGTLGSGSVVNNGTLVVNRSDALTLNNPISGTGSLALDGGGTTTLGGVNTFSGGIVVASGTTLAIADSTALGSGPLALVGSSTVPAYFKITSSTSIANRISVQGDPVFDVAPGAIVNISSPLTDGSSPGDVVVQGGGTLAFLAANTYTGPTAIVAGSTLALADAGSIAKSSSVSNQGKLDLRGIAGNGVALSQFSQGAGGQLLMRTSASAAQLLSVAGTASLNGTLAISAQPGNYKSGVFKLISADQVSGAFSSVSGDLANYVRTYTLLYGPQGVDLEMVLGPDAVNSRQALGAMASAQAALMKQRNQLLSDMLSQECLPSQAGQSCMAIEGRHGRSTMGNEGTGLISGAWQVSPTLRMGGYLEQGDVKLRNGGVGFSSNAPNLGAFLRWNANTDGSGLQARVSFATQMGSLQMTRDKTLADTEAGSGTASLQSYALGAELAWAIPVGASTVLKPYLGLQDTRSQRGAYTEASTADVAYPISYEAFEHNNLYTIAGLRMSGIASDRFSYQLSGGLQYKEKRYGSDLSGSSPVYKMDAFALDMRDTSANPEFVGSADLRYHFGKDQQVTAGLALRGPISDAPQVFKATLGYQVSF
jgi:autotransporter-associated beta strand protein